MALCLEKGTQYLDVEPDGLGSVLLPGKPPDGVTIYERSVSSQAVGIRLEILVPAQREPHISLWISAFRVGRSHP